MGSPKSRWMAVAVVVIFGVVSARMPIAVQGQEMPLHPSMTERILQADDISDPSLARRALHKTPHHLFSPSSTERKFDTRRFLGMSWLTPTSASPESAMIAQHPLRSSVLSLGALVLKQPADRKHSTLLLTTDTTERMADSQDAGVIATISLQF